MSIDFQGNPHSSIVDAPYTKVMDGDFVKVLSWYDNEWGYSNRCVDLLRKLVAQGPVAGAEPRWPSARIRDLDLKGRARLHPRRLQRPAEERRHRRRHADPRVAADDRVRARAGATRVVLASHLGRPEGQAEPGDQPAAGRRAARRAARRAGRVSPTTASAPAAEQRGRRGAAGGGVVLLENLRFHPEEEKNDAGVRAGAGRARRRLRQRRVRRGAPRARVGRGDRRA